jgi:hypothetical protein
MKLLLSLILLFCSAYSIAFEVIKQPENHRLLIKTKFNEFEVRHDVEDIDISPGIGIQKTFEFDQTKITFFEIGIGGNCGLRAWVLVQSDEKEGFYSVGKERFDKNGKPYISEICSWWHESESAIYVSNLLRFSDGLCGMGNSRADWVHYPLEIKLTPQTKYGYKILDEISLLDSEKGKELFVGFLERVNKAKDLSKISNVAELKFCTNINLESNLHDQYLQLNAL